LRGRRWKAGQEHGSTGVGLPVQWWEGDWECVSRLWGRKWEGVWVQGAIGVSLQEGIGKRPGFGGTSVRDRCISGVGGRGSEGVELVGTGY